MGDWVAWKPDMAPHAIVMNSVGIIGTASGSG